MQETNLGKEKLIRQGEVNLPLPFYRTMFEKRIIQINIYPQIAKRSEMQQKL